MVDYHGENIDNDDKMILIIICVLIALLSLVWHLHDDQLMMNDDQHYDDNQNDDQHGDGYQHDDHNNYILIDTLPSSGWSDT